MTGAIFLVVAENVGLALLGLAAVLTLLRLFRGPTLPDRIMALDMLTMLAVSAIGIFALKSELAVGLDIALALCLVGFVSTVALARFVLARHSLSEQDSPPPSPVPR